MAVVLCQLKITAAAAAAAKLSHRQEHFIKSVPAALRDFKATKNRHFLPSSLFEQRDYKRAAAAASAGAASVLDLGAEKGRQRH